MGVEVLIDFAVLVGAAERFTNSLRFDSESLLWFGLRGIGVVVSAYPCSDNDPETAQA
jgi:hypothetical protein